MRWSFRWEVRWLGTPRSDDQSLSTESSIEKVDFLRFLEVRMITGRSEVSNRNELLHKIADRWTIGDEFQWISVDEWRIYRSESFVTRTFKSPATRIQKLFGDSRCTRKHLPTIEWTAVLSAMAACVFKRRQYDECLVICAFDRAPSVERDGAPH